MAGFECVCYATHESCWRNFGTFVLTGCAARLTDDSSPIWKHSARMICRYLHCAGHPTGSVMCHLEFETFETKSTCVGIKIDMYIRSSNLPKLLKGRICQGLATVDNGASS